MGAGNPGWNGLHPMYSVDLLRIAGDASGVTWVPAWSYLYRPGARRPPAWYEPRMWIHQGQQSRETARSTEHRADWLYRNVPK